MQTIGLHDTVTLRLSDEPGIRLTCDMPGIPTDERNLAYRAAALLFTTLGWVGVQGSKFSVQSSRFGVQASRFKVQGCGSQGLDIAIEKRIPPEAGLGGGSSNAASVLLGCSRFQVQGSKLPDNPTPTLNSHPTLNLEPGTLNRIAAGIGSDVPFFLVGGTAFVRGRGEEVEPLPDIRPWWLVVVKPPFGVSTPWAYRRLDELRSADGIADGHIGSEHAGPRALSGEHETASDRMRKCILEESCSRLPELLSNDLEQPAIKRHPEIAEIKEALLAAGASGALMCGSGSAVFGLFESEESANHAATGLHPLGEVFVTRTVGGADA
jgi:4-diphosphocytidyl-2-C-methyl-D-erythritol kinase